jgi:hypothetical protein
VDITVLQHGRTPLRDVEPAVIITRGDATKTFAAKPTGKPGVYRAEVVFPSAGRWEYQVDDGFVPPTHTFPAVQIEAAPAAAATSDDGGPNLLWLMPGIALLLAAAALAVRSRGRHDQQPQAA